MLEWVIVGTHVCKVWLPYTLLSPNYKVKYCKILPEAIMNLCLQIPDIDVTIFLFIIIYHYYIACSILVNVYKHVSMLEL